MLGHSGSGEPKFSLSAEGSVGPTLIDRMLDRLSPVEDWPGQRWAELAVSDFRIRIVLAQPSATTFAAALPCWTWFLSSGDGYDYLLLIGEKPARFHAAFPDPAAGHVFFLVPRLAASGLCDVFPRQQISLPAHPDAPQAVSHDLFRKWSVTKAEIEEAFAGSSL